ncbi:serine/threonine-protein kinase [Nocardia arizonensis]|uniref:serine/threonine-protein kinase n=1 Tax=Nocardia arizonensis TaxID=1141647 RepID=UPI0009EBBDDD|nr:serine/threonine-protein kinase [Nocardia arizonensis]
MLRTGETFAGYLIKRVLGQGGMGTVYLAQHPRLPRLTALKLLERDLYGDVEIRSRFEREADLVARLDHPNIVTVYDRGAEDDQLWISMQFVPGSDAAAVDVNVLAPWRAVQIIAETGAALDFAHANGVLHRDVKPANILLAKAPIGQPERVLLTDFGIAGMRDSDTTLGSAGTITATLAYASPEQLSGHTLDHRCDQYSLACTLFWMLTGTAPFNGASPAAVMNGHLYGQVPALGPLRAGIPPALDAVLAKALAKRPEDRFDTCTEFARAARRALAPTGPQRAPTGPQRAPTGPRPVAQPPRPTGYPYAPRQYPGPGPVYGLPPTGHPPVPPPVRPQPAPGPGNPRTSTPRGPVQRPQAPAPTGAMPPGYGEPPRHGPPPRPTPHPAAPPPGVAPTSGTSHSVVPPHPGAVPSSGARPSHGGPGVAPTSGTSHSVVPPYPGPVPRHSSATRHGTVPPPHSPPVQPQQSPPPQSPQVQPPRVRQAGSAPTSEPVSPPSRAGGASHAVVPDSRAADVEGTVPYGSRSARAPSPNRRDLPLSPEYAEPTIQGETVDAEPTVQGTTASDTQEAATPSSDSAGARGDSAPVGAARPVAGKRPVRPITIDLPEPRSRRVPPAGGSTPGGRPAADPHPPP